MDCLRARVKKHTEQNPEQAKARWARAQANRDWAADHTRRKDRDPEYSRRRNIKNSFGITLEKYREHFEQQGPHCGICERAIHVDGPYNEDKAVLDHDHKTGELRSFLCPRCNVMIGMATDCPDILEKGATYLAARKLPW